MIGNSFDLTHSILSGANIGLWAIEIDNDGSARMYADDIMKHLLGVEGNLPPEQIYHAWYDNVDEKHYDEVMQTVEQMRAGSHAEVQYPWHHPSKGLTYVRCGGVRNYEYDKEKGIRLEGIHQDITQLIHIQKQKEELELKLKEAESEKKSALIMASKDSMTSVYNRAAFMEKSNEIIRQNKKTGAMTCVMYVDLDDLKIINDRFGHDEGDFSILSLSGVLNDITKGRGIVGRLGGDEFACLISYRESDSDVQFFRRKIEKALDEVNKKSLKPYNVSASIGTCCVAPYDELDIEDALNKADVVMYNEKKLKK